MARITEQLIEEIIKAMSNHRLRNKGDVVVYIDKARYGNVLMDVADWYGVTLSSLPKVAEFHGATLYPIDVDEEYLDIHVKGDQI